VGDHQAASASGELGNHMNRKMLELVALTALSGLAWGIAFSIGHHIAVAVFAAITCATAIITFALHRALI
jgi:hypothetical protein